MSLTMITTIDEWINLRWIRRYRLDDGRIITMELFDYEDGDP